MLVINERLEPLAGDNANAFLLLMKLVLPCRKVAGALPCPLLTTTSLRIFRLARRQCFVDSSCVLHHVSFRQPVFAVYFEQGVISWGSVGGSTWRGEINSSSEVTERRSVGLLLRGQERGARNRLLTSFPFGHRLC